MDEKILLEGVAKQIYAEYREGIVKGLSVCAEYFERVAKGSCAESMPSEIYFVTNDYNFEGRSEGSASSAPR